MVRILLVKTIILLLSISTLQAQEQWDYPSFPDRDFEFEHLDAEIRIDQEQIIEGDITYSGQFLANSVDSISLDAVRMQVEDVIVNDRTVDYEMRGDYLNIIFHEPFSSGDSAEIQIKYRAQPMFGIHQNYNGTVWTSLLPRSTRHWLPVMDHPRSQFTVDLSIIHPSAKQVAATGEQIENEVVSVDEEMTRFRSRYPVPVTALFFGMNEFETVTNSDGDNHLHAYFESESSMPEDVDELFSLADETLREMETQTGVDYPHRDLHILFLDDLMWETEQSGAGAILVDQNKPLEPQIKYGILSQWMGVLIRQQQWSEPEMLQTMRGFFANRLDISPEDLEPILIAEAGYDALLMQNLEQWSYYLENHPELDTAISQTVSDLFDYSPGVMDWEQFVRLLYDHTGQPFFERPEFVQPVVEEDPHYTYRVDMQWDEDENSVRFIFETDGDYIEELVTVRVEEVTLNDRNERELTFTGARDEVEMSVSSGVENIILWIDERDDITLEEQKPFMFWIHQIKNADEPEARKAAADGLLDYTENPDLQLALRDVLNVETTPAVYASILNTLAYVTDGASGTDEIFMERSNTNQHKDIQKAAADALSNYVGNSRVISNLRSLITNTDYEEVRVVAIKSLAEVVDPDAFENIVESLMVQEPILDSVPLLLRTLAEKGKEESAVRFSETFISREFPFTTRYRVLDLMLEYDRSSSGWENRLEDLLNDPDPRIRYKTLDAMEYLSDSAKESVTEGYLYEEFDQRVRSRME